MIRPYHSFALLSLGIAAACATVPPIMGDPAVTVTARAETPPVGTANEDAADDPAIWRNAADPAASLVVGTDKKGGLYVYDLKGAQKSFLAAPGLNNVDLVELPDGRVLVGFGINPRGQVEAWIAHLDLGPTLAGDFNEDGVVDAADYTVWRDNLGGDAWHTPMDLNNRGDVVGFGNPAGVPGDAFGIHAFLWTRHAGIVDLGVLEGDATSQALGINGRGQVVGLSSGPNGNRAVLWEGGERTDLNTLVEPGYTGTLLIAGHINDAGVITGSALDGDSGEIVTFVATPAGKQ